jgi:hypothetical protein
MIDRLLFTFAVILTFTVVGVLLAQNCAHTTPGSWCREWPGYSTSLSVKPQ